MTALELSLAYVADWIFGDPKGFPHPVKLIGRAIQFFEKRWLREGDSTFRQRLWGGILMVLIVGGAGLITWGVIRMAGWIHPTLSSLLTVFFAYTTLATQNLYVEVREIVNDLEKGELSKARTGVGYLVSRDTGQLDEGEVCRALIETTSENTSDGIVAPLFYLTLGGPPLAMAYKALSTLDSMIGYKNERYRYFGWASARADDLANFIPARMTVLFFTLSSLLLRKDWRGAWRVAWRDGGKNPSPNSGYPEAAVAGALNIQLGGENYYFGRRTQKPLIGDPGNRITIQEVKASLHLMIATSLIAALVAILIIQFQ
ncbi:MAG: adenosylcobinamide-phosphate synthase CbiB [Desulfobacterota bacterium]|nr:adenosylcobinamide-phosphate synthase CbiB [Thermodesulfobacteriota bacterium]